MEMSTIQLQAIFLGIWLLDNMAGKGYIQVVAVVRYSYFQEVNVDRTVKLSLEKLQALISVVEVLPTYEDAKREADRLNDVNADSDVLYYAESTRWYPDGRIKIPTTRKET